MRKFLPFALVLVALSSGCTVPVLNIEIPFLPDIPGFDGPTVVQYEHDIIIIKSLEAIPSEIDAGQTTKIIAYIQNIGDKTVGTDDKYPINVELYDFCLGLFKPKVSTCRGVVEGDTICKIKNLLPGETVPVMWTLEQAGNVPLKTICPSDGMKVLVGYHYRTQGLTTVSFIGQTELERTLQERTYKSTDSYIVAGQGPIKPYITVEDKQPIPIYTGAMTVLGLQIKNMGSGRLDSKYGPDNEVGIDGMKFITITGIKADTDLVPTSECKFGDGSLHEDVRLIGAESPMYLCKIDLQKLDGKVLRTATRHVQVEVEYDYIFTKSVLVTVNPKFVG